MNVIFSLYKIIKKYLNNVQIWEIEGYDLD